MRCLGGRNVLWEFLRSLVRGLKDVQLAISDTHEGLKDVICAVSPKP
ncbi:MAG TPA: hypothetical protein GXX57_07910 [Firmicutes bacterium]|nr:hypothetical protein [Bacillota bacterium]